MKEKLKNFAWGYVVLFAILVAIGALCIGFHNTLPYVAFGIGLIITVFGIIYGVFAIASKDRGVKFAFKITVAVCSIVAGVVTMIFSKDAVDILTALIGLFLIIDGSFKLQSAAISKRYKSVGWWLLLVPSLIAIIGGFLISRYESGGTDESVSFISVSLGIILIVDALSNLLTAFLAGKLTSAKPDGAKADCEPQALPEGGEAKDEAPAVADAKDEAPAMTDAKDEAPAATDAKDEAPAVTDAKDEAPAVTDAKDEAPAATDAKDEAPAVTDAKDEAPAVTDAKDEAPAVTDAKDEAPAVTDAPKEDKPEEN